MSTQRRKLPRRMSPQSIVLVAGLLLVSHQTARAENVLLIIADDLGAESLASFSTGAALPPTPRLDGLAASGIRFTSCWANPTCSPSRAALLTGRHGFRTGVGFAEDPIDLSEGTIADAFSNGGYATACIGKWHLSDDNNGGDLNPNLMGFDHYSGSIGGGLPSYDQWPKVVNGQAEIATTYATRDNVNDAVDWIAGQESNPWFLWLAFNAPHVPYHLPPDDLHGYENLSGDPQDIEDRPKVYFNAMIEAMDSEIGRLLDSIDSDVLANTTVVFVGDNGTEESVSSQLVRGSKALLWEGGVHVPCIVWGPSVAAGLDQTHPALIHFTDVFKTVLDVAGLDVDAVTPQGAATDSVSFAAYLSDPSLESFHNYQFTERFVDPARVLDGKAIGNYEYKLIRYDSGTEEFFHRLDEFTDLSQTTLSDYQQLNYDELSDLMASLLGSNWTEISFDSLEDGWGTFTPTSESVISTLARHASDGTNSANIQADSSFETTSGMDVSNYAQLEIAFTFRLVRMDAGEGFFVEYYDGLDWHVVAGFSADDYDDLTTYDGVVTVDRNDYEFPLDAKIRFVSAANSTRDDAYIDAVAIRATSTNSTSGD